MKRLQWLLLGLAVADVVFFGGWIGVEAYGRTGKLVRLPAHGYDPRDLLSGHYIRYRLDADDEARAVDPSASDFCLEMREGMQHVVSVRNDGCAPFLHRDGTDAFTDGHFYIDEKRDIAFIPMDAKAYIVGHIDRRGRLHVVDLVVDGTSLAGRVLDD